MVRSVVPVLAVVLFGFSSGCASDKQKAIEGLNRIRDLCDENDKDAAKKLSDELRGKNKVFDKAFDAAIDDKRGNVNVCSPLLHTEISLRIEHGS